MSLKKKSFVISFGSIIFIVVMMGVVIYGFILSGFQKIENQRTDRALKSLAYAYSDKFRQLDAKLGDWAVWDDTYQFIADRNQEYIDSNLVKESFSKLGVDEVLFINTKGALVESFLANDSRLEHDFPADLYVHFSTGSALLRQKTSEKDVKGIIKTDDGLLLFSVAEIYKSDGTGPSNGFLVFASYFDAEMVQSFIDLTQSKVVFVPWTDTSATSDFQEAKKNYTLGRKQELQAFNHNIIMGYHIIEDIYKKPQGILRIEVLRDITLQGKTSMTILLLILSIFGLIGANINFFLMNFSVLKRILSISTEMKDLGKTEKLSKRLVIGSGTDEIDRLRININKMLTDIEESQKLLKVEVGKQELILELVDVAIVILDNKACVSQINRKGCELLGYANNEIVGMNWIENVIIPEQRKAMTEKFKEIMDSNITANAYIENSLLTKDKKIVSMAWHNTIIRNAKGEILSTLSVGSDITEKKKTDLEKEDYTNTLKRLNELMVGRELKMIELKEQLKQHEK